MASQFIFLYALPSIYLGFWFNIVITQCEEFRITLLDEFPSIHYPLKCNGKTVGKQQAMT